jgi:ligand-binding SRPBCC domain-containing protein
MKVYEYHAEQLLGTDIKTAWNFFSSPKNLSLITPPDLGFIIKSKDLDAEIFEGMKIEYVVKPLFGIPLKWITAITKVSRPHTFTDKQLKGPYALWEHHHEFIEKNGNVLMIDHVRYALPFGWIGSIARGIVHNRLEHIFTFRRKTLEKLYA